MDDRSESSLIGKARDYLRLLKKKIIKKTRRRMPFLLRRASLEQVATATRCDIDRATINILPEDVLLIIFDYYVKNGGWEVLVRVCPKWRYVVFQSPLRLNLRIRCSGVTPTRERLALWPPFPITIEESDWKLRSSTLKYREDNITAALGHGDRVCAISLAVSSSLLESIFPAMQKTFVALEDLWLFTTDDKASVVSDSFLGGSAPHLRRLKLLRIQFPFPVLRNLLLSAPNLVTLYLHGIPHSAYFSPEAIVTCLSALTRLNQLRIGFKSPRSRPPREGRHRTPTRSLLPALTELRFVGISEYLEDLVTRIDTPLLSQLCIKFFHQLIFDTPQLVQFICRTPMLKACDETHVIFSDLHVTMALSGRDKVELTLGISCSQSDWQLSSMAQVFASFFPHALIPMPENLYIIDGVFQRRFWQDDLENNQWLGLFHPFTAVKNFYLSQKIVPRIAPALQELVGERVPEVLPNLQSIVLEDFQESGFVPESMRQFIAARQLSSHPITISHSTSPDKWMLYKFI